MLQAARAYLACHTSEDIHAVSLVRPSKGGSCRTVFLKEDKCGRHGGSGDGGVGPLLRREAASPALWSP